MFIAGVGHPRKAVSGRTLPDARLVSSRVHKDLGFHDHAVTLMFLAWGQLLDHDVTLTAEAKSACLKWIIFVDSLVLHFV